MYNLQNVTAAHLGTLKLRKYQGQLITHLVFLPFTTLDLIPFKKQLKQVEMLEKSYGTHRDFSQMTENTEQYALIGSALCGVTTSGF